MLTAHEKGALVYQINPPFDFCSPETTHTLLSRLHSQHTHTHTYSGSQHQSMMERGTSLAEEDRGKGG